MISAIVGFAPTSERFGALSSDQLRRSCRCGTDQLSVDSPTNGGSDDHGNEIHSSVRFQT